MARNEEKHFCKLNRIILKQQKDEEAKKNPKRPKLNTLSTSVEIKRWLPTIKKDIDFYIKQSKVWCYPERKISEFNLRIEQLRREHQAFVWKLRQLDPSCEVLPGTDRPYTTNQRVQKRTEITDPDMSTPEIVPQRTTENKTESAPAKKKFKRISLPVLDSVVERMYAQEVRLESQVMPTPSEDLTDRLHPVGPEDTNSGNIVVCDNLNASSTSQDLPLDFNSSCFEDDSNFHSSLSASGRPVGDASTESSQYLSHPLGLSYGSSSEEESSES